MLFSYSSSVATNSHLVGGVYRARTYDLHDVNVAITVKMHLSLKIHLRFFFIPLSNHDIISMIRIPGGVCFMRKLSILFLVLCLLPVLVLAQTDGDFTYSVHDGQAIITAYTGSANSLIIPDMLGGYPVTVIRYCAFRDCSSLSQVSIPDGVRTIGSNAFRNCTSLTKIALPDSLVFIDTHAFYGCSSLKQLAPPESIERLHPYAFYGCSAIRLCGLHSRAALILTDFGLSFTSPDYPHLSLMAHEDAAGTRTFTVTDCDESAVHVVLPDGVTHIEGYAFFNCASLTEITMPDSVTDIAYSAFEGCSALGLVILSGNTVSIAESAFARCPSVTLVIPEGGD